MLLLGNSGEFFALDIGTSAIRVVELAPNGKDGWIMQRFGYISVDPKTTSTNSKESGRRLGESLLTLIGQSGIKTKNVVVGIPAQKTFTTVIDMPMMSEEELRSTIKYQLDQYVPMNIEEAKVDWVALGQSAHDPTQQEILVASTANSYAEERLEFLEGLGFNVVAAEPDSIAMARAVLPGGLTDGRLLVDVGEASTSLVMTYNDAPRLVRTIPMGLGSLVKAAVQNLNVQDEQARQFILKFGLAKDRLEGQVYRAVEGVLESFVAEVVKSIKFFQTRYPNVPVGGIILVGYASVVPAFGEFVSTRTELSVSLANPWQRVQVRPGDEEQLRAIATEFATAVGLAQRKSTV